MLDEVVTLGVTRKVDRQVVAVDDDAAEDLPAPKRAVITKETLDRAELRERVVERRLDPLIFESVDLRVNVGFRFHVCTISGAVWALSTIGAFG